VTRERFTPADAARLIAEGRAVELPAPARTPARHSPPEPQATPCSPTPHACQWRCHTCGSTFTAWAPAERHGRTMPGHRRIALDLDAWRITT
jgi:hypothetical protein